jgi:capsular polysaccharide biosynthesis protein
MELRQYWKPIKRRWWLVVAPLVVVAAYVLATYTRPGPVYQVTVRYAAGTSPALTSDDYDRYYPWLTSEYVANGLADVAMTGAFAEAVAARLAKSGEQAEANAIQRAVISDNSQSILVIYLTWHDQTQAVAIADAISAELSTNSSAYFPQTDGVEPAVRALDQPTPVAVSPGLRAQITGPAVKLALALVAGAALALLCHYLDPTVRDIADLRDLDMPVLGEIPRG